MRTETVDSEDECQGWKTPVGAGADCKWNHVYTNPEDCVRNIRKEFGMSILQADWFGDCILWYLISNKAFRAYLKNLVGSVF